MTLPEARNIETARHMLDKLHDHAQTLRTEILDLRLAAERLRNDATASHLVEANEQLVLAALHAETIAELAVDDLDELTRSSQLDELTGTPNRALMLDRLEHAIAVAKRHKSRIAVLFVDLDDFKQVNDRLGHAVGDEAVRLAARRLESAVRKSDSVSRHGGDEFLVLVSEIMQASAAAVIADKILAALAEPCHIAEHVLSLSASIGIAIFPEDGADASTLIRKADVAMYHSKRRERGQFAFHTEAASGGHGDSEPDLTASSVVSGPSIAARDLRESGEARATPETLPSSVATGSADLRTEDADFRATVADELRSSFTSTHKVIDLLRQVRSTEPLMQVLVEKHLDHLSTTGRAALERCEVRASSRSETRKTGQFAALAQDGTPYTILEFTVINRSGAPDQTRREITHRSFGLANGDLVSRLNTTEFEIASSGRVLTKCPSALPLQAARRDESQDATPQ